MVIIKYYAYREVAVRQRCGNKKMMYYKDLKLYPTISVQKLFIIPSWKWACVVQLSTFSMATTTLCSLLSFHSNQNSLISFASNYMNNYYSVCFTVAPKLRSFWFKISEINRQTSL